MPRTLLQVQSLLACVAASGLLALGGCGPGDPGRPNVVLVTVDTLRPDHLGSYGHRRETDPALARLAASGIRFEHAIAQASWTLPSIASLLTSLYPSQHGADSAGSRLPEQAETLAEALRAAGYHTIGVVSHGFVARKHGMAQGFDVFDESNAMGHEAVTSKLLTETALDLADDASAPFFLWTHYFDPHYTYVRHAEFGFADGYDGPLPEKISAGQLQYDLEQRELRGGEMPARDLAYVKAVYDEEVAHTDRWFGALRQGLADLGLDENTIWIFTADHGEYFLERGLWFHGKDVYEPLVHVPLVIGGAVDEALHGTVVEATVELRSIPATVMALLGISEHPFGGQDLLAVARGAEPAPAFTEGSHAFAPQGKKQAVVQAGWKLIHRLDEADYELYALEADPGEVTNLWDAGAWTEDARASALRRRLDAFATLPRLEPARVDLSAEELERLEALGYVRER